MVHLVVHLSWRGVFLSNGRHGRSVELGVVVASCTCWTCMYCTSEVMVGTNVESGIELSFRPHLCIYPTASPDFVEVGASTEVGVVDYLIN